MRERIVKISPILSSQTGICHSLLKNTKIWEVFSLLYLDIICVSRFLQWEPTGALENITEQVLKNQFLAYFSFSLCFTVKKLVYKSVKKDIMTLYCRSKIFGARTARSEKSHFRYRKNWLMSILGIDKTKSFGVKTSLAGLLFGNYWVEVKRVFKKR